MRGMVRQGIALIGAFSGLLLGLGQEVRWLQHPSGRPVMAYAVSGNGQVVVGELPYRCAGTHGGVYYVRHPLRWVVPTGEIDDLTVYGGSGPCYSSVALDANRDGSVIVGDGFRFDVEELRFTLITLVSSVGFRGTGVW